MPASTFENIHMMNSVMLMKENPRNSPKNFKIVNKSNVMLKCKNAECQVKCDKLKNCYILI